MSNTDRMEINNVKNKQFKIGDIEVIEVDNWKKETKKSNFGLRGVSLWERFCTNIKSIFNFNCCKNSKDLENDKATTLEMR